MQYFANNNELQARQDQNLLMGLANYREKRSSEVYVKVANLQKNQQGLRNGQDEISSYLCKLVAWHKELVDRVNYLEQQVKTMQEEHVANKERQVKRSFNEKVQQEKNE